MKKLIIPLMLVVASCTKEQDYTCTCIDSNGTKFDKQDMPSKNHEQAQQKCNNLELQYRSNNIGGFYGDVTCELYY